MKKSNYVISLTLILILIISPIINGQEEIKGNQTVVLVVGFGPFLNYDVNHLKAELRKMIGNPKYRGKGYAKEATKLWINYGFCNLDLKKIYLNTFDTNIRNIRLNEEVGFRVEGILGNEVFVDGEYKDVLRMGLWRK